MDTGMIAIIMMSLLVSIYVFQQFKQKGVVVKKRWIIVGIILGILTGALPFVWFFWKVCTSSSPFGGC